MIRINNISYTPRTCCICGKVWKGPIPNIPLNHPYQLCYTCSQRELKSAEKYVFYTSNGEDTLYILSKYDLYYSNTSNGYITSTEAKAIIKKYSQSDS